MCNMNCLECTYNDCINNHISDRERKAQDNYDRECIKDRMPEERKELRKGALKQYDYNHSDKGRASRKRYEQSDKGKATAKRKQQKRIASGKNAAYCRAYYYRKKKEKVNGNETQ